MFVLAAGLLAMMILPRLKQLSPVYYRLSLIVIGVLMFGFIAGSTVNDASGFLGFTVLCGIVFLGLLAGIYYVYRPSPLDSISIHKHHILLHSPHIFPIYSFNTMVRGRENPLTEVNERVWTFYGVFGVMYLWGVFALFFMAPTTVGLTVSSLALAGAFLFTSELLHRASVLNDELAEAIDYLEEGSPMYYEVLNQAKWIATRNQLLNDTTLFISTKQNRLAVDVGIQTDALTPGSLELTAQQSIITHLEHVYTHQNWETVYAQYTALSRSLPKTSCCGIRRDFNVNVEGVLVSRREAFRLCDSLFLDSSAFYRRNLLYQLNVQQELIKAVRGKQYDRLTQIIAMLRDEGNFTITVDYLKTLDPLSEEMQRYEASVDLWVEKRARLLAELARVKAERDADQRRRDTLALLAQEEAKKAAELKAIEDLKRKGSRDRSRKESTRGGGGAAGETTGGRNGSV